MNISLEIKYHMHPMYTEFICTVYAQKKKIQSCKNPFLATNVTGYAS